jgi:hypothetical protein
MDRPNGDQVRPEGLRQPETPLPARGVFIPDRKLQFARSGFFPECKLQFARTRNGFGGARSIQTEVGSRISIPVVF